MYAYIIIDITVLSDKRTENFLLVCGENLRQEKTHTSFLRINSGLHLAISTSCFALRSLSLIGYIISNTPYYINSYFIYFSSNSAMFHQKVKLKRMIVKYLVRNFIIHFFVMVYTLTNSSEFFMEILWHWEIQNIMLFLKNWLIIF